MATLATSWLITTASPTRRLRSPPLLPPRGDQAYVRFTPKSGQTADVSECPLCARSRHMQRSKMQSIRSFRRRGRAVSAVRREGFAERNVMEPSAASIRLRPRELDHLGPLLGFLGNEFPEIGRRA